MTQPEAGSVTSLRVEMVTGWRVWPRGCDPSQPDADLFAVTVTWRGEGRYSVDRASRQLSRAGNWAMEVPPFRRHQYRFDSFEQAQAAARSAVDDVEVGGRTWPAWQQYRADVTAAREVANTPAALD